MDHGNDGLVVAGTTGEAPVLTDDERLSLWAAVCEAVDDPGHRRHGHATTPRTPCTSPRRPPALGVAGILAVVPVLQPAVAGRARGATSGPSPAATDLPVMIYDIPVRTGRKISTATLLAPGPRGARTCVALKDAAGQPRRDRRGRSPARRTASRSTAATTR